jgi:hypothetical protein
MMIKQMYILASLFAFAEIVLALGMFLASPAGI